VTGQEGVVHAIGLPAPEANAAEVDVAGAPAIPCLRFRHNAGPVDIPALAAVRSAAFLADGMDEMTSAEALANELEHAQPERWVPERDLVVVDLDRRVIGWSWRDIRVEPSGTRILCHRGYVEPEVRRRGIGTALLRHPEADRDEGERSGFTLTSRVTVWRKAVDLRGPG
jgi:GNAT superfamily N-acetyltransferase